MLEKEFKFKIENKDEIIRKLFSLNFNDLGENKQEDIYFDTEDLKLFNQGKALRIRKEGKHFYLTYKNKVIRKRPKIRKELTIRLNERQLRVMIEILNELGYNESLKIIKKRREFEKGKIKVAIDEVEGLGNFLEVEYESEKDAKELLSNLGLKIKNAIGLTYAEMLKI